MTNGMGWITTNVEVERIRAPSLAPSGAWQAVDEPRPSEPLSKGHRRRLKM
jgi:hypothetical protein